VVTAPSLASIGRAAYPKVYLEGFFSPLDLSLYSFTII
jgi:hypothetical protein